MPLMMADDPLVKFGDVQLSPKLKKLFTKNPPKGKFNTLKALVSDFRVRFPTAEREPVAEYAKKAKSLEQAIDIACRARGENGKMHNHQSKVPIKTLLAYRDRLSHPDAIRALKAAETFDQVLKLCEDRMIKGIGPVTSYDVAYRIGCYLRLTPTRIWLHAGVKQGAKNLGLDTSKPYLDEDDLPFDLIEAFDGEDMNSIEDFLCCYRSIFPRIKRRW